MRTSLRNHTMKAKRCGSRTANLSEESICLNNSKLTWRLTTTTTRLA
jgi:hypothetical protein